MKKIFAFCLSIVMVASLSVTAFATSGFVSSPSGNLAPELVDYENESEECQAKIKIVPYSERHTLPDDSRMKLEEAYSQIVNASNDNIYAKALAELAALKGVKANDLSVSDLFDISYSDCEEHDDHGGFTITLRLDALAKFVGILHFTGDEWESVDVTDWNSENNTVTFKVDDLSPFAVVVSNSDVPVQEDPGFVIPLVVASIAAVGLAAIIVVIIKKKKKKDNK